MHFTFEDDAMQEEPEPEEPPVPPDPSAGADDPSAGSVLPQNKSILDAADADPSEKSMALGSPSAVCGRGYTIAARRSCFVQLYCSINIYVVSYFSYIFANLLLLAILSIRFKFFI